MCFKKKILIIIVASLVTACVDTQWYFYKSNLNALSIGISKSSILSAFSNTKNPKVVPLIIRATKTVNGELIEIGEVPLMSQATKQTTTYWFLFVDGYLKQWGEPRDWQEVKARYEINYNPSASVNY